jgi:hypothetical protein
VDESVKRSVLETNLDRQLGWIAAADAKTGFVFAAATAMLGLLAAAAPRYGQWTIEGVAASITAAGALVASLGCLAAAVFPRTAGPKLSTIFFGAISARDLDEYRRDVLTQDEAAYLEDLIQQCHINAQISSTKYYWLKRASVALYFSVIPWICAAYLLFRDK